jgi:signal transduction histidine kinase
VSSSVIRRLGWLTFMLAALLFAFAFGILALNPSLVESNSSWGTNGVVSAVLFLVTTLAFPLVGILVVSRQPTNLMGWIMLGVGLCWGLDGALVAYADYALASGHAYAALAAALDSWLWVASIGGLGTFLLLLFPNGRLPSRSWTTVAWLSGFGIVATSIAILLMPGPLADAGYPELTNPLGIMTLKPLLELLEFSLILIPLCIVAAAVSLVQRYRRSGGIERMQLKWLAAAATAVALLYLLAMIASLVLAPDQQRAPTWVLITQEIALLSLWLIPISIGLAILKHRLYDIDVVISKTVVFGALAAFITLVYVAIVVGIGHVIGSGDRPNLGLSILATAIVAIAFQPVRERVQHFANRLVYGHRATPYEVLSEFSDRVGETYASEDVLGKMAQAIKEGTGAAHAEVWLRAGKELRPAASWPPEAARGTVPRPLTDGELPTFDDIDKAIAVRHQGELLGALTMSKPRGEPLTPAEEKLLTNLASQAGLVLRNVGLTTELLARLEELKASRQRLVAAQDEARRRLERDLHDGAQQHLVALKMRLALAKRVAQRDPAKAEQLIGSLEHEADEALETLRDLARGIYPPLLADQGLVPALDAQARKAPVPVEVVADDISRYPQEIEAAVYFCCLEALQNVAKYASPTRATVTLEERAGELSFSVTDDGRGFDPETTPTGSGTLNMSDRLEALGGSLSLTSTLGRGTTVTGRVPVRALEPVV